VGDLFSGCGGKAGLGRPRFGGRHRGWLGGWLAKFTCAEDAISRIGPLLMRRLADPLPIEAFCSVSSVTHGTILLPTRHAWANVQCVIPRRMASGWWCGVSQVVKTAQSRGRTERTLLNAVIFLSADAPSRARNAADRRDPSLRSHITLCYNRVIMRTTADAFLVVSGRCTGGARRYNAKQGRHGKTALTCGSYSQSSTVLERRRERVFSNAR
jgi:hypothetical protein